MNSDNIAFNCQLLDLPSPKEIAFPRSVRGTLVWESYDCDHAIICHVVVQGLEPPVNPRALYGRNLPDDAARITFYMTLYEEALEREARERINKLT